MLRLVTGEAGAHEAGAEYRRLGRPAVFYLPLHALEVEVFLTFDQRQSDLAAAEGLQVSSV